MSRIHTTGRAWHDPAGGTTAWQRERWTTWAKVHRAYRNRAEPLWRSFGAAVLFFAGAAMLVGLLGLAK